MEYLNFFSFEYHLSTLNAAEFIFHLKIFA